MSAICRMAAALGLVAPVTVLALLPPSADAASLDQVMASRYMKYNFCMEDGFGQGWRHRFKVPFGMNRWGVSEPTESGIKAASQQIKNRDAECRKKNELAEEPRPRQEAPEKQKPD